MNRLVPVSRRRIRYFRPRLERLEDRTAPIDLLGIGLGDGLAVGWMFEQEEGTGAADASENDLPGAPRAKREANGLPATGSRPESRVEIRESRSESREPESFWLSTLDSPLSAPADSRQPIADSPFPTLDFLAPETLFAAAAIRSVAPGGSAGSPIESATMRGGNNAFGARIDAPSTAAAQASAGSSPAGAIQVANSPVANGQDAPPSQNGNGEGAPDLEPPGAPGGPHAEPPGSGFRPSLPPAPGSLPGASTKVIRIDAAPRLAGPETELITPYQRHDSQTVRENGLQFHGRFVVELAPEVSSEELARSYGAVHEFAYPNLGNNLNVWTFGSTSAPPPGRERAAASLALRNPEQFAAQLRASREVQDAYVVYESPIGTHALLNDPLLPAQWHLANSGQTGGTAGLDANVPAAWDLGVTGRGVTIGVVDEGVQDDHPSTATVFHPDLTDHIDPLASWDFRSGDDDPNPVIGDGICNNVEDPPGSGLFPHTAECHGTAVAGVAAASGNNGIGVTGAAPDATIGSVRFLGAGNMSNADFDQMLRWDTTRAANGGGGFDGSRIDIYNNSWGPGGNTSALINTYPPGVTGAVNESVRDGRGGLGSIYVFSAGNSRAANGSINYSSLHSKRQVIGVAAVAHDGSVSSYSNPGSALLIGAPSNGQGDGISTTDLITTDITSSNRADTPGYTRSNYTNEFGGTSSAAPLVTGVIALMLEANPNLTYRDVQHILVNSASRQGLTTPGFVANQAGRFYSHDYGFGLVNAAGAVNLAKNWRPVSPELVIDTGVQTVNLPIPDNPPLTVPVNITADIRVESVEVVLNATHLNRGDLRVELLHTDDNNNTVLSTLAAQRAQDPGDHYSNTVLTSRAHWGVESSGTWSLRVSDPVVNGFTGSLNNFRLRIYGTKIEPDPGPRVVNVEVTADQIMRGQISDVQVQFDRPIDSNTFAPSDVGFTRIVGGVSTNVGATSVTPVLGTNNMVFDVDVPDQSEAGNYRIEIGPDINGANGLQMDQNADSSDGFTSHMQVFDLGARLMFGDTTAAPFSATGPFTDDGGFKELDPVGGINIPAGGVRQATVGDMNVLLSVFHGFPSRDLLVRVEDSGGSFVNVSIGNASNTTGETNRNLNGYWDTVIDDESPNGSIDALKEPNAYHYADSFTPQGSEPLTGHDGKTISGTWRIKILDDNANDDNSMTINDYMLVITPSIPLPDVRITGVTNFDLDRNLVEVDYAIGGGTVPSPLDLSIYASRDAVLDFASDDFTGAFAVTDTNCTTGSNCLAVGPHTVEIDASLFPDPETFLNHELFALVTADPGYKLLDPNRSNNTGVLMGVTEIPNDGTLWVAGDPYGADTVTLTGNQVTFTNLNGGQSISFTPGNVSDVFVATGGGNDTVNASAVTSWMVLAMLGGDDDTYTGGSQIDAVLGGAGHDALTGNGGADRLYGMDGNDDLDGGAGNDLLSVGAGGGAQSLNAGTGNDSLLISGTAFDDRITIWDPDGDTGAVGSRLNAIVSHPNDIEPSGALITDASASGYEARTTFFQPIDLVPGDPDVITVLDGEDDNPASINLGTNQFNFYGTTWTGANQLFVNPNGLIMFGQGFDNWENWDLNTFFFSAGVPVVAPFWDDLQTNQGGSGATNSTVLAKFDTPNNRLIIEWSNVPHFNNVGNATFQAILQLNTGATPGAITFNYVDVDFGNSGFDNGASATIGIQNANTTLTANQLSFDGDGPGASLIGDNTAFVFAPPAAGMLAAVVQEIAMSGIDAGDRLLVSAAAGNDLIRLENPAVVNSRVGLASVMSGGLGNDTIFDGLGPDTIYGDNFSSPRAGDGNDTINTDDGAAHDLVFAGGGTNVCSTGDGGDTRFNC